MTAAVSSPVTAKPEERTRGQHQSKANQIACARAPCMSGLRKQLCCRLLTGARRCCKFDMKGPIQEDLDRLSETGTGRAPAGTRNASWRVAANSPICSLGRCMGGMVVLGRCMGRCMVVIRRCSRATQPSGTPATPRPSAATLWPPEQICSDDGVQLMHPRGAPNPPNRLGRVRLVVHSQPRVSQPPSFRRAP